MGKLDTILRMLYEARGKYVANYVSGDQEAAWALEDMEIALEAVIDVLEDEDE